MPVIYFVAVQCPKSLAFVATGAIRHVRLIAVAARPILVSVNEQLSPKGADMDSKNRLDLHNGGPLHYFGNRALTIPDLSGHMIVDSSLFSEVFTVILVNLQGKKYKRWFEPFAGSASWSIAAMGLGLAEEYVINESDSVLVDTYRVMRDYPESIKQEYAKLTNLHTKASSSARKELFVKVIDDYNQADSSQRALLLPFIINHSWGGMIFHDDERRIVYQESTDLAGQTIPGYLEDANLSLDMFLSEVDRVAELFNSHKLHSKAGTFYSRYLMCNAVTL